jgi:23S rRNA pseudouridine1911/1915/1917 synthase
MPVLCVVRETGDWLVVDKPPHRLSHPTRPDGERTLWHDLHDAYREQPLALVNRLDRDTSGLVLVARHREAAGRLGKLVMGRAVQKTYRVLVRGIPPEEGVIDAPLGRLCRHGPCEIGVLQGVVPGGYPAQTRYRRLETRFHGGEPVSLLEAEPVTGRLHQIRAHLRHAGFPVVGDKLYGPDPRWYLEMIRAGWTEEMARALWIRRQALHACRLRWIWNGEAVDVASEWPPDLQRFWDGLAG